MMVGTFKRILVAIGDVHAPPRRALLKAGDLARHSNAAIELYHAASSVVAAERIRVGAGRIALRQAMAKAVADEKRALTRLARSKLLQGVRVSTHSASDYPPHEAIVRRAIAIRADLVIAESLAHRFVTRLVLVNTDWELIRACPCPLLLVKTARRYDNAAVIAAVDPLHANDKPARLDTRIIKVGNRVAALLGGRLHLFHAYMPLAAIMAMASADPATVWLPQDVQDQYARRIHAAFDKLARSGEVPRQRRHLREGIVPVELQALVKRVNARIVVMGAVSRSGLKRIFIGSTAERVLDGLSCDVLIVKARDFRTPVPARSAASSVFNSPVLP